MPKYHVVIPETLYQTHHVHIIANTPEEAEEDALDYLFIGDNYVAPTTWAYTDDGGSEHDGGASLVELDPDDRGE